MAFQKGRSGNPNGRPRGTPNKVGSDVKQMTLEALHHAGGAEYLCMQAYDNPKAFLALVGRVLPLTIDGKLDVGLAEAIIAARKRAGKS